MLHEPELWHGFAERRGSFVADRAVASLGHNAVSGKHRAGNIRVVGDQAINTKSDDIGHVFRRIDGPRHEQKPCIVRLTNITSIQIGEER